MMHLTQSNPEIPELISVITVCRNAVNTIEHTLDSVAFQDYPCIEHCIIDAASTDGTVEILKRYGDRIRWISEPDKGLYDAMNKGVAMSTGSIIGFLNADDEYAHNQVVSNIAHALHDQAVDACFADIEFRDEQGCLLRRYDSSRFHSGRLAWGWMPAHPSLYVRREIFDRFGGFKIDYKIAADFEFIARVFSDLSCRYHYVSDVWVHMRPGGLSTRGLLSSWILNQEIVRACRENNISTNMFKVLFKFPMKCLELLRHRV